jgi:MoaA/NifB/PqqE/SkfB family radical SAM enzyme
MSIYRLISYIVNSRVGQVAFAIAAGLMYIAPVRKFSMHRARRLLNDPKFWINPKRNRWEKINAQYRGIALAALTSLERVIEMRILAPRVARIISGLWARAFFPSNQRFLASQRFRQDHGSAPPWFLVISPTRNCNLNCTGCYANAGSSAGDDHTSSLPWNVLDRIMTEAREKWGVPLFVFSGGEPLAYQSQGKDLLDIVEKFNDCLFLMFTNGTLITEEVAGRLARLGNLTPALSVEGLAAETGARRGKGVYRSVLRAISHLRNAGVPFGISMTATRSNCEKLLADPLLDFYFGELGAFYAFIFQYMPIGRSPDLDWMPKVDQRIPFWKRSWEVVNQRQFFLLDFWNHGPLVEGCIAAGREKGYMHVDWNGDVMPCVFMPYVAANLPELYARGKNLDDAWESTLFRKVRQWQVDYGYGQVGLSREGNWLLPCPFRDHNDTFQEWIRSTDATPEAGVASKLLTDAAFCERLCSYGAEQAKVLQPVWESEYLEKQ